MLSTLRKDLQELADSEQAKNLQRFFKTGKGEYGEGDVFLGLRSQQIKDVAKKFRDLSLEELQKLIVSEVHEERMTALRILTHQYKKYQKDIFEFYIKNASRVNNWDLVDTSAPYIVGDFLLDKDKSVLYEFAKSNNLWRKRIAIVSTYGFIRQGKFEDTLKISEILLNDSHDLIHKAVGWMLREVGNRNLEVEEKFLKKYYKKMPRTMLRYAIEKFEEGKRLKYLRGEI